MKKFNILTVDDDVINLKLLEVMLKKNDNIGKITKASNGLEAINILEDTNDIDLILLDIVMPVMNGLEFLDNLQNRPYLSTAPIIVLTTDETTKQESFNKGAFDFITKPIFDKELRQKIDRAISLMASRKPAT